MNANLIEEILRHYSQLSVEGRYAVILKARRLAEAEHRKDAAS